MLYKGCKDSEPWSYAVTFTVLASRCNSKTIILVPIVRSNTRIKD